jgi:hypothetical protein
VEDPPHDGGLLRVDVADDVAPRVAVLHLDIAVAVDEPAGDVAPFGVAAHGVPRALAALLPVHFVHKRHGAGQELVDRGHALELVIGEIEKDPHAGVGQPFMA